MKNLKNLLAMLCALGLLAGVAGCKEGGHLDNATEDVDSDTKDGPMEKAGEVVDGVAKDVGDAIKNAAGDVEDAAEDMDDDPKIEDPEDEELEQNKPRIDD